MQTKSLALATHPLFGCLAEAEKMAKGLATPWVSRNKQVTLFLEKCIGDIPQCSLIPEMQSKAADNAAEINAWLRQKGFSIQLPPEGHLFLASILELMVKWLSRGTESRVKGFKAVKLKKDVAQVFFDVNMRDDQYIVEIATQSADRAYMFIPDEVPQTEWEVVKMIVNLIRTINSGRVSPSQKFEGVVFPEVDLDTEPDVSWVEGMSANGNDGKPLIVTSCKEQVKLKLDCDGASIKAAAAMGMMRGLGPVPYIVDRPFLFWVTRPGLSDPIIWSYLAQDSWVK